MKNIFNYVSNRKPRRNAFDLSHERKFSCDMAKLIPILCEEVVPGDTMQNSTELLVRFAPMLAPMMHRVNIYTHFFFVPNRIVWDDFQKFITGGEDGTESPVVPYMQFTTGFVDAVTDGTLADYLGVNIVTPITEQVRINSIPFRAYQTIFNEYYRDQNLSDPVEIDKGSGEEDLLIKNELVKLRKRAWEKDYFTSSLPFTQRGGEVLTPLSGTAPVVMADENGTSGRKYDQVIRDAVTGNSAATGNASLNADGVTMAQADGGPSFTYMDPNGSLDADLSQATASSINELRRAARLQEWLEKMARGGSRYIEQMLTMFGVRSSDARLQRPEYLGGGRTPVVISEVVQTSDTDLSGTAQGNMAGHGIAVGKTHQFKKFFEEHGYVIGIMSVVPRSTYQQGLRKHFFKQDRFDYFWPDFAHLGEQEVLSKELYFNGDDPADDQVFGYQARYSEYKYIPSTVHGDFKTNLSYWHMGRIFSTRPALNENFVLSDPAEDRVFAVTAPDVHNLYVQCYNNLKAIRPMPIFSYPKL